MTQPVTSDPAVLLLDVPPGGAFLSASLVTSRLDLLFAGQPGSRYDVERSTNLIAWTTLAADLSAPANGLMSYVENPATNTSAFYRLKLR